MKIDDSAVPEFASHDSYGNFARRVRRERRYATDAASRAFIATVLATAPSRQLPITKDAILYRAQLDIDEFETTDDEGVDQLQILGLGRDRMIPKPGLVMSGRANPAGIAYLYLASSELTAISEVRPWIGVGVSVAQFGVKRDLRALDLTKGHGEYGFAKLTIAQMMGEAPVDANLKRRAVWTDIDSAFSRPVSQAEEIVDYVPTQVLAEAFREAGYEAIVYRSNFGDPGYNIVLFDLNDANILNCCPYTIRSVAVEFEQCGNTWFAQDNAKDTASTIG
ncbi:MAG: RES family NAD+ phosphorylase [Rhizomicrobium sp.]